MSHFCPICSEPSELVFDLPSLPMTGILVKTESLFKDPLLSNSLMFCASCSHGFLANQFDYELLYGGIKQSVTGGSRLAREMNKVFESFIVDECPNLNSKTVLEFGAGDLFLANRLKFLTHKYYALEPSLPHKAVSRDMDISFKDSSVCLGCVSISAHFGISSIIRLFCIGSNS